MLKYANQKRRVMEFNEGVKELLKLTPQIWKKIMGKTKHRGLVTRYDGPFEIIEKVGVVAYKLKLSEQLKFHPTFHVCYLRPFYVDWEDPTRSHQEFHLGLTNNLMIVSSRYGLMSTQQT